MRTVLVKLLGVLLGGVDGLLAVSHRHLLNLLGVLALHPPQLLRGLVFGSGGLVLGLEDVALKLREPPLEGPSLTLGGLQVEARARGVGVGGRDALPKVGQLRAAVEIGQGGKGAGEQEWGG